MASFPFGFWRLDPTFSGGGGFGINYGYDFDGVDEYINLGSNTLGIDRDTTFSFSCRVRFSTTSSGDETLLGRYGGGTGYFIYKQGSNIAFRMQQSSSSNAFWVKTTSSVNNNEWYTITVTYDGSQDINGLKIYFNGVSQSLTYHVANTLSNSIITADNDTLGAASTLFFLDGRMDDVQFFNFVLNQTQVDDIHNNGYVTAPTASPIYHWKMGESDTWDGSNWVVVDEQGSLNGTSVNMEETDRKLGVAYSMTFDGVDEEIVFPTNVGDLPSGSPWSISLWIKNVTATIIGKYDGTGYSLYVGGSIIYLRIAAGGVRQVYSDFSNFNSWVHVTITYNGLGLNDTNNYKFYRNSLSSTVQAGGGGTTTDPTNSDNFRVSSSNGYIGIGGGDKMYISFYDTELSQSEVTDLYNSGIPIDPRDVSLSPTFFAPLGGPNDTWDGSNWTVVDEINGNNGTSVNMEEVDKTSETP